MAVISCIPAGLHRGFAAGVKGAGMRHQGRVIERGTHAELVDAGGLYAKFAAEQSAKSELEAVDVDDPAPQTGEVVA